MMNTQRSQQGGARAQQVSGPEPFNPGVVHAKGEESLTYPVSRVAEANDIGCFHSRRLESTRVPVWTVALQSTTELHRLNLAISSPSVILSEPFLPSSEGQPDTLISAYLCETFPCQNTFCSD